MVSKATYLLVAICAIFEAFVWVLALPLAAMAIVAWGVLVCARFASARARMLHYPTRPTRADGYDSNTASFAGRPGW